MKVSLISNVNMDYVIAKLKKDYDMCPSEGYGNLYGSLLDPNSKHNVFNADINIVLIDIDELIGRDYANAKEGMDEFFKIVQQIIKKDSAYFISDVDFRSFGTYVAVDTFEIRSLEEYWSKRLYDLTNTYKNVYRLEYKKLCEKMGKTQFYSDKMWYMGKIVLSMDAMTKLCEEIKSMISSIVNAPKKVLVLDMDNTLWGGVVGEDGYEGIKLSDEHEGAIYKDFQRVILRMKELGVILCIASKNNEGDVKRVLEEHPHMLIKDSDISCKRINWVNKDINIREMADELNLGLDSFVFIDDSQTERELVKQSIPQVEVVEFPKQIEKLPEFMEEIYFKYFRKLRLTEEDRNKTEQYKQNAKRHQLEKTSIAFNEFLERLEIKARKVDNNSNIERIHQLINKSNQFNLTTKRMTMNEVVKAADSNDYKIYAFNISDKFGDSGVVGIIMVKLGEKKAYIENFVMSCRVMGRKIENYLITYVENDLREAGIEKVIGTYIPTEKNIPVKELYNNLGYTLESEQDGIQSYELDLKLDIPKREYFVEEIV